MKEFHFVDVRLVKKELAIVDSKRESLKREQARLRVRSCRLRKLLVAAEEAKKVMK